LRSALMLDIGWKRSGKILAHALMIGSVGSEM
jgi:hypothetical protein